MKLFRWLKRNDYDKKLSWEETAEGKAFCEKYKESAIRRAKENEAWERDTPVERKIQVKLFKIFFTIFFILYSLLLIWGFNIGKELWFLLGELILSLISLCMFFCKPKKVKYPNCFMMPVIAFGCVVLIYVYMGLTWGFNPGRR